MGCAVSLGPVRQAGADGPQARRRHPGLPRHEDDQWGGGGYQQQIAGDYPPRLRFPLARCAHLDAVPVLRRRRTGAASTHTCLRRLCFSHAALVVEERQHGCGTCGPSLCSEPSSARRGIQVPFDCCRATRVARSECPRHSGEQADDPHRFREDRVAVVNKAWLSEVVDGQGAVGPARTGYLDAIRQHRFELVVRIRRGHRGASVLAVNRRSSCPARRAA